MGKVEKILAGMRERGYRNVTFEEISRYLFLKGYTRHRPRRGSSHYNFRKTGRRSIPVAKPKGKQLSPYVVKKVVLCIEEREEK